MTAETQPGSAAAQVKGIFVFGSDDVVSFIPDQVLADLRLPEEVVAEARHLIEALASADDTRAYMPAPLPGSGAGAVRVTLPLTPEQQDRALISSMFREMLRNIIDKYPGPRSY